MGRRVLPVVLTIAAAILDGHGSHGLARDALLAAVPFAAVAALLAFGEYLEAREDAVIGLQALLWGAATTLLVVSCAARSPDAADAHLAAARPLGARRLPRRVRGEGERCGRAAGPQARPSVPPSRNSAPGRGSGGLIRSTRRGLHRDVHGCQQLAAHGVEVDRVRVRRERRMIASRRACAIDAPITVKLDAHSQPR